MILLGSFTLWTCTSNDNHQEKQVHVSYCSQIHQLFAVPDSLPQISTNGDSSSRKFVDTLPDLLGFDLCDISVNFGIKLPSQISISVWVDKTCHAIKCPFADPKVSLWQASNDTLMLNYEQVDRNRLKWEICKALLAETTIHQNEIATIGWAAPFPPEGLSKLLHQVLEGYLLAYNHLAQKHYQRSVCALTSEQIDYLKREIPFFLLLKVYTLPKPLPINMTP